MLRTFLRQSLVVLAAVGLFLPIAAYYAPPAQAWSVSVNGDTCSSPSASVDGSGNVTITCGGGGGGSSFTCSLTSDKGLSPTVNDTPTLTVGPCSNALGTVSYAWALGGSNPAACPTNIPGGSQNTAGPLTPAPGGSTTVSCNYTVTATDSGGASGSPLQKSITLRYTAGGGGGGGNIDTSACVALGLNPIVVTVPWGFDQIKTLPNFGPNDALIIAFTTSSVTTSNSKGQISAYEYPANPSPRAGALSNVPCDFTVGLPKYNSSGATWFNGQNPNFSFTLFNPLKGYAVLAPNTQYYLNITNFVPAPPPAGGAQYCNIGNCPMQTMVNAPPGTY